MAKSTALSIGKEKKLMAIQSVWVAATKEESGNMMLTIQK